ncbi:RNA polymerase sigma factor SigF [Streptomyces sp. SID13666]|uniref:RNA polymerase sigma factor SigF n=1 Tax=Streptomyces TaxID=1883 RepID=UPI0011062B7D|nr:MULTISPECIES: RNA polymerase sigma factor SigF [Streptomyces]MCZ4099302.1 RNA polymerase sigma factor SigF [Streptomyces sp. H39-C1]NEA59180.1 RNA polymerase sigma factor SigF [Streptomyces sp. SID13666]NEA75357.1 RNA polymerase sigma factor SigF [Streptomyces sp. SID13588]QNA71579.1 RNA polymerase sigma factor SigF [Streptomyces sp. So13.3]
MGAAARAQGISRTAVAPGTAPETVPELPWVEDAGKVAPTDARALSKIFFDQLQVLEEGTHEYQYARNTLIELNMALVKFAARRFRNRSEPFEDIVQVGTIGLIKAIDRFDLSREVEFPTFAVPYIIGEIKRFFRDTSWAVHVPRRLQELRLSLAKAIDELSAGLDRSPTTAELAAHLDLTTDEVVDGLMASNGYTAGSLDMPASEDDERGGGLADLIGDLDPAMAGVENLQTLKPLVAQLNERDRRILQMRFGDELTQAQIGAELGVSQMHVSRLLSSVLARLREGMLAGTC